MHIGHVVSVYPRAIIQIVQFPNHVNNFCAYKVPIPQYIALPQSSSELDPPSASRQPSLPRDRDVPASSVMPESIRPGGKPFDGLRSPRCAPSAMPWNPHVCLCDDPATIPLHQPRATHTMTSVDVVSAMRLVMSCIDICLAMVVRHKISTDATSVHFASRKKMRSKEEAGVPGLPRNIYQRYESDVKELEHTHVKQILTSWHGTLGFWMQGGM